MMTNEELKTQIKELRIAGKQSFLYGDSMLKAADSIEELSVVARAQKAVLDKFPHWISVTERLPDAEKEVYVTDGEYIARAILLDEVLPGDKPCWSYSGLGEITHWCTQIPLPQPPKEK